MFYQQLAQERFKNFFMVKQLERFCKKKSFIQSSTCLQKVFFLLLRHISGDLEVIIDSRSADDFLGPWSDIDNRCTNAALKIHALSPNYKQCIKESFDSFFCCEWDNTDDLI